MYGGMNDRNINSVAYLMDTNVWSTFAGTKAEYAMGGPTIELFCASYKQTHPDKYIDYNVISIYGYDVKSSTNSEYDNIAVEIKDDFNHIYIESERSVWLASPSSQSNIHLLVSSSSGYMGTLEYNNNRGCSLRPIVCLKSDVRLKKTSDGVYAIQ